MAKHSEGGSVKTYIVIALILGVITYIEFAIVEYDFAFLTSSAVLFWLIVLSVAKFVLVVAFFMHLFYDPKVFTGFFASGMVITVGTLAILALLFTVQSLAQLGREPEPEPVLVADFARGERLYAEHCALCHQPTGQGIAGAFPPHAGHLPLIAQRDGGREYLIGVLLNGLQGEIRVFGAPYRGIMPSHARLNDQDIADVLNYALSAWGNDALLAEDFVPIGADEVAAARPRALDHVTLLALRDGLGLPEAPPPARELLQARLPAPEPVTEVLPPAPAPPAVEPPADVPAERVEEADWLVLGQRTYTANCAACHQVNGQGIPGAFPPLAGHAPELVAPPGGRVFLIHSILYGLVGPITVDGVSYNGVMPPWPLLSDDEVAAVLNYIVTAWGNDALLRDFTPITPAEVAAERGKNLTSSQVHQARQALGLD